jgi:hypothetical protein
MGDSATIASYCCLPTLDFERWWAAGFSQSQWYRVRVPRPSAAGGVSFRNQIGAKQRWLTDHLSGGSKS